MTDKTFFANEFYEKLGTEHPFKLLTDAQNRANEAGHDFACTDASSVLDDFEEEVSELREALEAEEKDINHIRNEIGDCFFSLINICRVNDLDVDGVLEKIAERWLTRKKYQEDKVKSAGYTWANLPSHESSRFWKEVKHELKKEEYL